MKASKIKCNTNNCFMCRYCLKDWLPAIEANRKNVDYTKGEIIFKEGEKVKGIYFIDKGSVKIYKHWTDEKELIVRFAKEGDIFGHRGLGSDDVYPVSATALEPLRVCYIEMSFFESSLKVNHEFLYELMQFFATQLKDSEKNMRNMAHMPVKGRVANALIKLKNSFGENEAGFIRLPIARQDIASYAGTTYETVFRIMNELVQEKIIKISGKEIGIVEIAILTAYCGNN